MIVHGFRLASILHDHEFVSCLEKKNHNQAFCFNQTSCFLSIIDNKKIDEMHMKKRQPLKKEFIICVIRL